MCSFVCSFICLLAGPCITLLLHLLFTCSHTPPLAHSSTHPPTHSPPVHASVSFHSVGDCMTIGNCTGRVRLQRRSSSLKTLASQMVGQELYMSAAFYQEGLVSPIVCRPEFSSAQSGAAAFLVRISVTGPGSSCCSSCSGRCSVQQYLLRSAISATQMASGAYACLCLML